MSLHRFPIVGLRVRERRLRAPAPELYRRFERGRGARQPHRGTGSRRAPARAGAIYPRDGRIRGLFRISIVATGNRFTSICGAPHTHHFTYGENIGPARLRVPSRVFPDLVRPVRRLVLAGAFAAVSPGSVLHPWRAVAPSPSRTVEWQGQTYTGAAPRVPQDHRPARRTDAILLLALLGSWPRW